MSEKIMQQPKQFYVLSGIEMWERFGFYGLQTLLVTYLVKHLQFDDTLAENTYGAFSALIYAFVCLGGWFGDKLLGTKRTMLLGAIFLAVGYGLLGLNADLFLYYGLGTVIAGNALFKANPSALVQHLYEEGDVRIDGAFTLYYMSVNIGSFLAMFFVPMVERHYGWNTAFLLSFGGMLIAITNCLLWRRSLARTGSPPDHEPLKLIRLLFVLVVSAAIALLSSFLLRHLTVAHAILYTALVGAVLYYVKLLLGTTGDERKKMIACVILIAEAVFFFILYQQTPTSVNLFTVRNVHPTLFGFTLEPESFMSLNPFWVMTVSPLLAYLYGALGRRNRDLSLPGKFALGMLLTAAGFLVLALAAQHLADAQGYISANWLVLTYLLQSVGELLISGLGLAMVARLAPKHAMGFMMGFWFMALALSGVLGGSVATLASVPHDVTDPLQTLPIYSKLFMELGLVASGFGLVMLCLVPSLKKLAQP